MFVVDAPVVMEWALPGQRSVTGERAFGSARRRPIVVPALWWWDTQNAVLTLTRRRVLTPERALQIRVELALLSKRVDGPPGEHTIDRTWAIATQHVMTFYDASYVELAMRLGLPLASSDAAVRNAAARLGLTLI